MLMKNYSRILFLLLILLIPSFANALVSVGIGKKDITPSIGTPSAGYADRKGEGMQGIHDPLLAIALYIDNGDKQIVLCSVDHLGFTYEMTQEIIRQVHQETNLSQCEVYIGSSHTHSGGGAYLNIPVIGEYLAGPYNQDIINFYISNTVKAIIESRNNSIPAKIGIGYGQAGGLSTYRGLWPAGITPASDVTVIKVTRPDDTPLAILFNYPVHPTVLNGKNRLFSSDFVGYARDHLQSILGSNVQPIYFNGAQGDIIPVIFNDEDRFDSCMQLGISLAAAVERVWNEIETDDSIDIKTQKDAYSFKPQPTPFGLALPMNEYKTEINLIVLNKVHAFVTIPGELSTLYDQQIKEIGSELKYEHVSIFGLTNDAHGYIILPDSWQHKTMESSLSFGGENYGEEIRNRVHELMKAIEY